LTGALKSVGDSEDCDFVETPYATYPTDFHFKTDTRYFVCRKCGALSDAELLGEIEFLGLIRKCQNKIDSIDQMLWIVHALDPELDHWRGACEAVIALVQLAKELHEFDSPQLSGLFESKYQAYSHVRKQLYSLHKLRPFAPRHAVTKLVNSAVRYFVEDYRGIDVPEYFSIDSEDPLEECEGNKRLWLLANRFRIANKELRKQRSAAVYERFDEATIQRCHQSQEDWEIREGLGRVSLKILDKTFDEVLFVEAPRIVRRIPQLQDNSTRKRWIDRNFEQSQRTRGRRTFVEYEVLRQKCLQLFDLTLPEEPPKEFKPQLLKRPR
jgi:hypothetical protein